MIPACRYCEAVFRARRMLPIHCPVCHRLMDFGEFLGFAAPESLLVAVKML